MAGNKSQLTAEVVGHGSNSGPDSTLTHMLRDQALRDGHRDNGLHMSLRAIPGTTKGDAAKILDVPWYFQCAPIDQFAVPKTRAFTQYQNFEGTTYITRTGKGLQQLIFRTVIVESAEFAIYQRWDLETMKKDLSRLVDAGYPMRLIATHPYNDEPEYSGNVVIESFTSTEQAGEPDARYLDLTFTQWRTPVLERDQKGHKKTFPFVLDMNKNGHYKVLYKGHEKKSLFNAHGKSLTFATIAKYAYGKPSLASNIAAAQKPPVTDYGMHDLLKNYHRWRKHGGKILVPAPYVLRATKDGMTSNSGSLELL